MVSEIQNGFGDKIFQGTVYLMNIRFNKLKKKTGKTEPMTAYHFKDSASN